MRLIPRTVIGACVLAGCAKTSAVPATNAGAAVEPTLAPVGVLAPSTAPSAFSTTPAQADRSDGEADDGERAGSASTGPLGSCSLTATLRDGGTATSGARFTLTLKNDGATAIRLVMPGDGSEVGWRTPILKWSATAMGKAVTMTNGARCGFMNPIEPREIVRLAPGESRDFSEWLTMPPLPNGTYEVRLTYRNDPGFLGGRMSDASEEVKHLIAGSSACEVTTNAVRTTLP
jgi:hypothetical protein